MEKIKNKEVEKREAKDKIPLVVLQSFLVLSITIITAIGLGALHTPLVNAQEATQCYVAPSGPGACTDVPESVCQELLANGGSCEDTLCSQISSCKLGCGFDSSTGECNPNIPKLVCDSSNNCEFHEDPFCNINQCGQGCCVLGNNVEFTTQTRCQVLSEESGLPSEFKSEIDTVAQCLNQVGLLNEGACVFPSNEGENLCKFTTKQECSQNINGNFHEGYLCSHPDLNTICEKQQGANCVEDRDEVYWIDSCGNKENIYSTDKSRSWNNGLVLPKEQSCNPSSDNSNSGSCGNCDYDFGSICGEFRPGVDSGNLDGYTCKDLNCRDSDGKNRINGESWCVYDGVVGGVRASGVGEVSADSVGSRHVREVCINGEVVQEACSDYRKEICVQNPEELDNGNNIDTAICRPNLWDQCIVPNSLTAELGSCEGDCLTQCANNPDCRVHSTFIDSGFRFNTCVPKIPPGFDLERTTFGGQSFIEGEQICAIGSRTCPVVYRKGVSGWRCIENCACQTAGFAKEMNNLCVSLGDCGAYVNYDGEVTDGGYSVFGSFRILNVDSLYKRFSEDSNNPPLDGGFYKKESDILRLSEQGVGDPFLIGYIAEAPDPNQEGGLFDIGTEAIIAGAFTYALGVTIASLVGQGGFLAQLFGFGALNPAIINPWVIGVAILVIVVISLLGIGKTKVIEVDFTCKPWQRPYSGDSCSVCGEDGVPCTQYRCEALGTRCELINENTGFDECIAIEGETGIPVITPWDDVLNKSLYKYEGESTNGFKVRTKDGECVQAFAPVVFGVETNILSQCRYSTEGNATFENMHDFLNGGIFARNHTLLTVLPSAESLLATEINNGEIDEDTYQYLLDQVGDIDFHIKCANLDGITNDVDYRINFCVSPGPDLTPPVVLGTSPESGSNVRHDATSQEARVFINEPAECRYSTSQGIGFNEMTNILDCPQDADGATAFGYVCEGTFPITSEENNFYIQCKDQPWSQDDGERNIGSVFEYSLIKTQNPLVIESISPNEEVIQGSEPITIELEASTSGGAFGGISRCSYSFDNTNFIEFFETNSFQHRQILNQMTSGDYTVDVKCEDSIGNSAQSSQSFSLKLDTVHPEVTRVFNTGGRLQVITNEEATCYYKNDNPSCSYNFENATQMESQGNIHSTPLNEDETYYIKCQDIWNNQPGSCSIVVRGYEL